MYKELLQYYLKGIALGVVYYCIIINEFAQIDLCDKRIIDLKASAGKRRNMKARGGNDGQNLRATHSGMKHLKKNQKSLFHWF